MSCYPCRYPYARVKTNNQGLYHYSVSYAAGAGKIRCTKAVDGTFAGSACALPRFAGTPERLKRASNTIRQLLNGSCMKGRNCWAHFSSRIGAFRSKLLLGEFWGVGSPGGDRRCTPEALQNCYLANHKINKEGHTRFGGATSGRIHVDGFRALRRFYWQRL